MAQYEIWDFKSLHEICFYLPQDQSCDIMPQAEVCDFTSQHQIRNCAKVADMWMKHSASVLQDVLQSCRRLGVVYRIEGIPVEGIPVVSQHSVLESLKKRRFALLL